MANVKKYTKAACGHLFKHYERAKEINPDTGQSEYVKFGNQRINSQLSHLNYNLAEHQKMLQGDFVRKRCSEVKLQNRKDVNVMCSWVLTAPKELPQSEQTYFFKASYEFMAERYGKENVISAYVHLDEASPHIHFAFVPVTRDKKKGGFKVSAKEVITKKDLQTFHQDLDRFLEKQLGHSAGVLNEATKDGNKTVAELKEKSALERVKKAEEAANIAEKKLAKLSEGLTQKELTQIDVTPKKLVGGFKGLTPEEAQKLKNTAEKSLEEVKKLKSENNQQKKKILDSENEIERLKRELSPNSPQNMKRIKQLADLDNQVKVLKRVIGINAQNYDEVIQQLKQKGLIQLKNHKLTK